MKARSISIILAILLLLFSAQAQDSTFNVTSVVGPESLDVFQCSPAYFTFNVQNLGKTTQAYTVSLDGDAADLVSVNPSYFTLTPGSIQVVQQAFNVPCDAKKTELFTIITSSYGEEKVLQQTVEVFKPENVHVQPKINAAEILSCQVATYQVELYNLVNFEETYSLSLDKFNENAAIKPNEVTLKPGEKKEVIIDLEHKNCGEYGDFPFNLLVETKNTELTGEVDLLLKVLPDHIVELGLEKDFFTNEFTEQKISVDLKNVGRIQSTYEVRLEGPEWMILSKKSLVVEPGQTEKINLQLNPTREKVQDGTYSAKLKVIVLETGNEFVKDIQVRVHVLSYLEKNAAAIITGAVIGLIIVLLLAISIQRYLGSTKRLLRVEQKRKEREKKRKEYEKLKAELKAKNEELELKQAFDNEYNKTRTVLFRVLKYFVLLAALVGLGWLVYTFPETAYSYLQFVLENWTWEYSVGAGAVVFVLILGLIIARLTTSNKERLSRLNLEVEKAKKREEARKLKEKERLEEWKKSEVNRLKKEVDSDYRSNNEIVPKEKLALLESERKGLAWVWSFLLLILTLSLILGFSYYKNFLEKYPYEIFTAGFIVLLFALINLVQSLKISSSKYKLVLEKKKYEFNAGLKLLQHVTFSLRNPVEKLNLKASSSPKVEVKPNPFVYDYFTLESNTSEENFEGFSYNFKVKKTWLFGNNLTNTKLTVYTNGKWKQLNTEQVGEDNKYLYYQAKGSQLGLFAVIAEQEHKKAKSKWPVLVGTLIALLLVGGFVSFFVLDQKTNTEGLSDFTMSKNGIKNIDLKQFFKDPDGDALTFTSENEGHLTVEITEGKAKIIPEFDWTGQTSLKFFADDGKGGITESNKAIIRVTNTLIPVEYNELVKQGIAALVVVFVFTMLIVYRKELFDF
ncbi:PGF-pre-PGF domain-containing protein [Candidatus Woesearchaeota archaeon]|nr:PGF-pre-PGF domain-containing protein [Candidatus Woesearchaeota archaeon]